MKLTELQRRLKQIEDCDDAIAEVRARFCGAISNCLIGALIERKNTLIERMREDGVNVDVEV